MALLPPALAEASPAGRRVLAPAVVVVLALVLVLSPLAGSAEAKKPKRHHAPRAQAVAMAPGQPRINYAIPNGSYFSFPNKSRAKRLAIRERVLDTVRSTWGGRRTSIGTPLPTNGTIRMVTWSFDDWEMARALVAAKKRGVSVQIVAAKAANKGHASWAWLRKKLGSRLYRKHYPNTQEAASFARQCRGACRGVGGTAHAKYFLFDNVGAGHARNIVVQTSMNLTTMAFTGQWNQAQAIYSRSVYLDYLAVFKQARQTREVPRPYYQAFHPKVADYFFPHPRIPAAQDPIIGNLNGVGCRTPVAGRTRYTQIRVIQYAIYGDRGVWIAKKLKALRNAGCNVAVIYSVASRPVLSILRSRSGRGPVAMKQSVVKDRWGNLVKYNHSKWLTIIGRLWSTPDAYVTISGSANWADLAFGDDEQTQRILDKTTALRHVAAFNTTWRQKTSSPPESARITSFGRVIPMLPDVPAEPRFGQGIYRYLPDD
ncbi:MAG: hypothetical protein JWR90_845 [Marmoricola sp.]|nr:hypothetical protein [Marmoricola sp.]